MNLILELYTINLEEKEIEISNAREDILLVKG